MLFSGPRWLLRRIGRLIASLAFITFLILSCAEGRAVDLAAKWNGGDGTWDDPARWSTTNFPNNTQSNTYDVEVADGTIDLNTTPSINGLFQSGGTITSTGGSTLFLNDDSQWGGGTFGKNTLFFMNPVTWTLDGGTKTFSGGAQLSYGEGAAVTTNWTSGDITLSGGSVWNTGAGVFTVDTSGGDLAVLDGGGENAFHSRNLFRVRGGGTFTAETPFNHSVSIPGGVTFTAFGSHVVLAGGGTHTGHFGGGESITFSGNHHFQGISSEAFSGSVGTFSLTTFQDAVATFDGLFPQGLHQFVGSETVISNSFVAFDNPARTDDLRFLSGAIVGSGRFTVGPSSGISRSPDPNTFWSGGSMDGAGTTVFASSARLDGGDKTLARTLETLVDVRWTAGDISFAGGQWINRDLLEIEADADMLSTSGTNVFHNLGSVRKQNSHNATRIEPAFNNDGVVEINSGLLQLAGGGTSSGSFIIGQNGALEFSGGTHAITGGSIRGADADTGLLEITDGVVALDAASTLEVLVLGLDGGDLSLNSAGSARVFSMTGGKLTGGGTLTATHTGAPLSQWSAGEMHDGTTQFADVTLNGGEKQLFGHTLRTTATTNWIEGDFRFNEGLTSGNGSSWTNSGTLAIQTGDDILSDGGGHSFINQGTITRENVGGNTEINIAFNNHGTLNIEGGSIFLGDGGSSSGTFNIDSGATLWFYRGEHALTANSSLSGDGSVQVRSDLTVASSATYSVAFTRVDDRATLTLNNNAATGRLLLTDGTLAGTGSLTVSGDLSQFGNGVMTGVGATTFAGSLAIDGQAVVSEGRTVETQGTTTLEFGRELSLINGGTWTNSGNFVIERQAEITASGSNNQFVNTGTFSKTSGTADTTAVAASYTNSGTVEVSQAATLDFTGGYTQTGGTLSLVDGGSLASPVPLDMQGGVLQGRGTVAASINNGGTIRPDLHAIGSAGITVDGDLDLAAGSLLDLSFGLSNNSLRQRAIEVTGNLNTGGTLQLGLGGADDRFRVGETYTLATAGGGIFGAFDNFASGAVFSEGEVLANIHYGASSPFGPNALVFEVTQAAPLTAIWNGTDSNWTSSSRWSTADFPNNVEGGERYNAVINSGRVTLNQDIEVTRLTLGSHLFPANGSSLTITDEWNWTGGHINASGDGGALVSQGQFMLTNSDAKLQGVPLLNVGDAQFVGRGIRLESGSTFTNEGSLHVTSNGTNNNITVFSAGAVINDTGAVWTVDTPGTATVSSGSLQNRGLLQILDGDFALSNVVSGTSSGEIEVAGGSMFTVSNGEGRRYDVSGSGSIAETAPGATLYKDGRGSVWLRVGSSYDVTNTIIHEGALIMDEPATLVNLEMHSRPGIRNGSAEVHVTGHFDWQGGRFGGTAASSSLGDTGGTTILDPGSTTLIHTTAGKNIQNHSLTNQGTVTYERGQVSITAGGIFRNEGTLNAVGDGLASSYRIFSGSTVNNAAGGLIVIDTGAAADFDAGTFNNSGTLRVDSGNFALSNVVSGTSSGAIEVAGGSMFTVSNGEGRRYDVSGSGSIAETAPGATLYKDGRGSVWLRVGSSYDVTNTIIHEGALIMDEPATLVNLEMHSRPGIRNGSAEVHVTGHFDWQGGRFGGTGANSSVGDTGGTTILDPGSTTLLSTTANKDISNHTLINHGDMVWQAGNISQVSSSFENHGTLEIQITGSWGSSGGGGFLNTGSITKSAGTGQARIQPTITSTGDIAVEAGTLLSDKLIQNDGSTQINAGATLLSFNRIDINGGSIGGEGTVQGHLRVRGELTPGASVGQLNVDGDLEFSGNPTYLWELDAAGGDLVHLTGNLIFGTGAAPVLNVSHLGGDLSGTHTILTYDGAAPTNQPAWTIQAGGAGGPGNDAHFINPAGGSWETAANWDTPDTVTGGSVVYASGELQVTGVTVGKNAPAAGSNVFIDADGNYAVTGPVAGIDAQNLTVGAATSGLAQLRLTSPDDVVRGTTAIGPRGELVVAGRLTAEGDVTAEGVVRLVDGELIAPKLQLVAGGQLLGTGDVFADIHNLGGTVAPGLSPGVIEVFGDYLQDADGVLEMEFAGTGVGKFDVLQVTGDVDLQGTVLLSFIDSFAPSQGDVFQFMISDSDIDFSQAAFQIMNLEPGFLYDLDSTAGVLQMTALNDGISPNSSNLVPEPQSVTLALLALLVLVAVRMSHRKPQLHDTLDEIGYESGGSAGRCG